MVIRIWISYRVYEAPSTVEYEGIVTSREGEPDMIGYDMGLIGDKRMHLFKKHRLKRDFFN